MFDGIWEAMRGQGQATFEPPLNTTSNESMALWVRGPPMPQQGSQVVNAFKGSARMAANMRAGRSPPELEAMLRGFRTATKTTGPVVLYRGMPVSGLGRPDRAFISCTASVQVAMGYAMTGELRHKRPEVVVAVLVPPGTPLLSHRGISDEKEFLLMPGTLTPDGPELTVPVPAVSDGQVEMVMDSWARGNRRSSRKQLASGPFSVFRWPSTTTVIPARYEAPP